MEKKVTQKENVLFVDEYKERMDAIIGAIESIILGEKKESLINEARNGVELLKKLQQFNTIEAIKAGFITLNDAKRYNKEFVEKFGSDNNIPALLKFTKLQFDSNLIAVVAKYKGKIKGDIDSVSLYYGYESSGNKLRILLVPENKDGSPIELNDLDSSLKDKLEKQVKKTHPNNPINDVMDEIDPCKNCPHLFD